MTRTADLTADVGDILLTEQQIADKVAELGRRIGEDYAGRNLTLVSVLKGSLPFMADLMRQIPLPLRICTLLDKPARRLVDIPVDYVGFEIPDQFVVGYGLDYGELYRNLRFVGVLKPEVYGAGGPEADGE